MSFGLVVGLASISHAATVPDGFQDQLVLDGFSAPMSLRFLPDGRMLVSERGPARVLVVDPASQTVIGVALEIPGVPTLDERGLLSIAVDPQWPSRPYLYAYYNAVTTENVVVLSRFTASGDLDGTGDKSLAFSQEMTLLPAVDDHCSNHNGGDLRFAPDGMLFLSIGDDENQCAAQSPVSFPGTILRLDVSGLPASGSVSLDDLVAAGNPFAQSNDAVARLVWALGLRNPFRMHVDPLDGSLFVADVGFDQREEIDHIESPGVNLGWPYREGNLTIASTVTSCSCWDCNCSVPVGFDPLGPIRDYDHSQGRSVISAGIYRAPAGATHRWPLEYEGDYFHSDFFGGHLRRLQGSGQSWTTAPAVPGQPQPDFWATDLGTGVVDFGLGPDGSLYYLNLITGQLRRIVYTSTVATEPVLATTLSMQPVPSVMESHTEIRFSRRLDHAATLHVYDVAGRQVRTLALGAGDERVAWDGRDELGREVASGLYLLLCLTGETALRAKVVKLR